MVAREMIYSVFGVSIVYFFAIFFADNLIRFNDEEPLAEVFYYPAHTVSMIALLIGGYWAAFGVVLGSFFWNCFFTHLSFSSSLLFLVSHFISYVVIYWTFITLYKPILKTEWQAPQLEDFIIFAALFSGIFTLVNQFIFFEIPEIDPLSIPNVLFLFIINFMVCSLIFILMNLALSLFVSLLKRFNTL